MKRKFFCITLIVVLVFCSFPLSTQAASSVPVITHPTNHFVHNSTRAITITWNAPTGTVSNYILSVRHLSDNKQKPVTDDYLIVKRLSLSASTRSYTIPWSKLAYSSVYRISVCAVMSNGAQQWSNEFYFFTTTYNVVANKTFSFYLYEGFPTEWKNAIYYAAQAWKGAMGLEYEVVNTYSFSQCHNNNTVIKGDGKNRITSASPDIDDPLYVMVTKKTLDSSGRAKEIDININDYDFNFSVGAQSGCYDIQACMTHEMGHASGLPHCFESFSSSWTMYHGGPTNDISKRSLEKGDKAMFCCLYLNA